MDDIGVLDKPGDPARRQRDIAAHEVCRIGADLGITAAGQGRDKGAAIMLKADELGLGHVLPHPIVRAHIGKAVLV